MGSKLKKIALPLAAIGIMAATGGTGAGLMKGLTGAKKGFLLGKTATGIAPTALATTGGGTLPILKSAGMAAAKGTPGLFGFGGKLALGKGTLAKGLMSNLANPLSLKGAATYGALGMAGKGLMADKQKKLDTSKDDDAAQAAYDYHMMMSKGIMSPEDARKAFASYGKGMKGDYTPGTEMGTGRYEELYPGLNYSGLTRYNPNPMPGPEIDKEKLREYNPYVFAAEGGMIDPLEEMPIITPMETEEERRMREAMEEIERLREAGFDFSQGNPVPDPYAEEPMTSMNYEGRADGGLMELAGSAGDPGTMEDADEHSYRLFNKPYLELDEFELDEFNEEMARLRSKFMADGGSVPQTESIPQGMQIDGRGGGFIPMGAKEKHDDVPAMLAKNEFVMTSDAVKAAGGGSVNKGAQVMYDLMNSLESKV